MLCPLLLYSFVHFTGTATNKIKVFYVLKLVDLYMSIFLIEVFLGIQARSNKMVNIITDYTLLVHFEFSNFHLMKDLCRLISTPKR